MNHDEGPRLPPELEHQIFELAYAQSRVDQVSNNLFLVAKRVHEWLIPLRFEVVMIHASGQWPLILERYGHHVHHFHASSSSAKRLLSFCPNVTNLAIWTTVTSQDIHNIRSLPITYLSINIRELFQTDTDLHSFCSNITHLDVSSRSSWATEDVLSHFPVLTHIALFEDIDERDIQACLVHGKALEVLVLISPGVDENGLVEEAQDRDDKRIVQIEFGRSYKDDWKEGAYGGMDMWVFSDEVIAKRRRGLPTAHDTK
ncbi:hypothetical protein BDN72DRAFT_834197 [Pluteus cervinus]|uniref:Uncharacterized protein n=1 Tax=Pluteus cervinus TaxID=181527 RepID=A0ACD3B8E6_9AGAR|nr:hypothetical protein BDN72DRAFT_834197 [Pluteus cervinus]